MSSYTEYIYYASKYICIKHKKRLKRLYASVNKCYCPEANFLSEIIAVVAKGPLWDDIKTFERSENYHIKIIIKILTICSILGSID